MTAILDSTENGQKNYSLNFGGILRTFSQPPRDLCAPTPHWIHLISPFTFGNQMAIIAAHSSNICCRVETSPQNDYANLSGLTISLNAKPATPYHPTSHCHRPCSSAVWPTNFNISSLEPAERRQELQELPEACINSHIWPKAAGGVALLINSQSRASV